MGSQARGSWRWSPVAATVLGAAIVAAAVIGSAGRADAHAFLINTDPAQGARLSDAPASIALQFSSPVEAATASVSVVVAPSTQPLLVNLERTSGGLVLRATLAQRPQGIYLVHWHIVADDGHDSDGEFAFAVGNIGGRLPAASRQLAGAGPLTVGASWLFFAGLASALGALATGLAVDSTVTNRTPALRLGLLVAICGAATVSVHAVGQSGGAGLSREGWASVLAVTLLCVAILVATWQTGRLPVLVVVTAAAAAWAAKGHAATTGLVGLSVDVVHLGVGATWAGSLAMFVWRLHRRREPTSTVAMGRRYARLALPLVLVLAAAGAVSALRLLPSWHDLWASSYGQLIIAKTVLFAAALSLALLARRRGLRRRDETILRRATPFEALAVALVLVVTAVLVNVAPPAPAQAAADLLGPPPLRGPANRDAGLAGNLTVSVGAADGQLQVEVFAPGGAVNGTQVHLEARFPDGGQSTLFPRPCGPGCFTQPLALPAGTTELAVSASAPDWPGGTFLADLTAPLAPEQPQLLTALVAKMGETGTFALTETVTSGPGSTVTPNRFQISASQFLAGEPYAGGTATDVQPLPAGGPGFRLYIAGDRIWVTIWLDPQGRIAREKVVDIGHDVERSFAYPAG